MRQRNFIAKAILALLLAGPLFAEDLPAIRKVAKSPFNGNGTAVAAVWWKQADRLGGLVNPRTLGVELCSSTVQMLYDDQNLYIRLQGDFNPAFRSDRTVKRSVFSDNNFEIFLKGEKSENYYHLAVSEGKLLYTGIGRAAGDIPGIRHYVFTKKNCWQANLIIPLKSIGLTAEDQKIRFNVCRYNIDMPKGSEQPSSFAVLAGGTSYHVPEQWETAEMTSSPGKAKACWPHSDKYRFNLIADPGFDFVTAKFGNPDIQRQETQLLTNIWIIRATGKAYNFLNLNPRIPLREGHEYTFKIRARRIGKEGSLGSLMLLRRGKNRYGEGPRPFWGLALSPEFQDYYLPFKFTSPDFHTFVFYRLGTRGNDTGVEVENISLYEGRISPLEFRKADRAGVKNIIPGTEIRLPDNPYGQFAHPLKVLVIGRKLMALADAAEVCTGLNTDADFLAVRDKNSDTYYTPGDPKKIAARLGKGEYDLYMVGGSDGIGERIGAKMAEQIGKNIQKGAGLFWNVEGPQGSFAKLLKSSNLQNVGNDHLLKQALPVELLNRPAPYRKWNNDPLNGLQEGKYGNGRIVKGETFFHHWSGHFMFQMLPDFSVFAYEKFPWSGFNKAWLARIMCYTAGKTDGVISEIAVNGNQASVKGNLKDGTALHWKVTDKNGGTAAEGKSAIRNGQAEIQLPVLAMSGNHVFSIHALTADGKTLDYSAKTFSRPGPRIVSLKDVKQYYSGADQAEIEVVAEGVKPGMTLEWSLEDFSGRILERGTAKAGEKVSLSIPLASLYTNQGNVEIALRSNGQVSDVKRIAVAAQDRDRKRLRDDFTPAVWNYEPISPGFAKGSDLQLEKIGIRSYLLTFYGRASLGSGMGTGYGWVNNEILYGFDQKNAHIRRQQYNTPESRKKIMQNARKRAESGKWYGAVHHILCDEGGIIGMNDASEVDEHPANIAEYRTRMKAKYGTVETFNRRMGTDYTSFEELKPGRLADARKSGRYGEFIEWRNFNVDRWCEVVKLISDEVRASDPEMKFSIGDSFGECPLNNTDYWKLTTRVGSGFSHEYTSMVYQQEAPINNFDEFYRSFRPDMRVWGYTGYFFDRAKAFFQPWWFALHRFGGFTWYGAYNVLGSTGGYYNLLDYTGAFTQDAANLSESLKKSRLQDGLGKLFLAYEWSRNDVAVYYSHDSVTLAFLLGKEIRNREIQPDSPLSKVFYSRQRITYALEELLYQYDFVAPEQIVGGKLKERKVLFMPGVASMSDAEVKAVKDFIAGGGLVIADFMPGTHDELGVKRQAPPFTASEVTVLEAMFNNKDIAQKQRILDALNKAGSKPLISVADAAKFFGREAMHFVHGNIHVFAVLRDQTKSKDSLTQTFTFPVKGHLYDLRAQKYLGFGKQVTATVPLGGAAVWGVYPYQVKSIQIQAPDSIHGCRDFSAALKVISSEGTPGRHILHAELIPPKGEARFFLKRNLTADRGQVEFKLRIAENDPDGVWTFRVTDVLSGISAEKKIRKNGK